MGNTFSTIPGDDFPIVEPEFETRDPIEEELGIENVVLFGLTPGILGLRSTSRRVVVNSPLEIMHGGIMPLNTNNDDPNITETEPNINFVPVLAQEIPDDDWLIQLLLDNSGNQTLKNIVPVWTKQIEDDWLLLILNNLDLYIVKHVEMNKHDPQWVGKWMKVMIASLNRTYSYDGDLPIEKRVCPIFQQFISDICYSMFDILDPNKWSRNKPLPRSSGIEASHGPTGDVDILLLFLDEYCIIVEMQHYGISEYLDEEGKPKTHSSFNFFFVDLINSLIAHQLDYCLVSDFFTTIVVKLDSRSEKWSEEPDDEMNHPRIKDIRIPLEYRVIKSEDAKFTPHAVYAALAVHQATLTDEQKQEKKALVEKLRCRVSNSTEM